MKNTLVRVERSILARLLRVVRVRELQQGASRARPLRLNIAPTDQVPVIRAPHKLEVLRWGLKLPNPPTLGGRLQHSCGVPRFTRSRTRPRSIAFGLPSDTVETISEG